MEDIKPESSGRKKSSTVKNSQLLKSLEEKKKVLRSKKVVRSKIVSRSSRPEPFLSTPGRYFHKERYFHKDIPIFQLIPAFRKIGLAHSGTQGYAFCFQSSSFSALFRFSINSCYRFDVGGIFSISIISNFPGNITTVTAFTFIISFSTR